MALSVIRGTKPRGEHPRARGSFDWDAHFRRHESAAPPRPEHECTVIPILDGWVRVLERQVAGLPSCRRIGQG